MGSVIVFFTKTRPRRGREPVNRKFTGFLFLGGASADGAARRDSGPGSGAARRTCIRNGSRSEHGRRSSPRSVGAPGRVGAHGHANAHGRHIAARGGTSMAHAELLLEPAQVLRRDVQIGGQDAARDGFDDIGTVFQHGLIALHGRAVDERELPLADADLGRCQAEHPAGELVRAVDEVVEGLAAHSEQRDGHLAGLGHQKGGRVEIKRERRHEDRTGRGKAEGRLLGIVHMKEPDDPLLDAEHVGADLSELDDTAARLDLRLLHRFNKLLHQRIRRGEIALLLEQLFQILFHVRNINHNLPEMQNMKP